MTILFSVLCNVDVFEGFPADEYNADFLFQTQNS